MPNITICDLSPSENSLCDLTEDELAYVLGGGWFKDVLDFIEDHPVLVGIAVAILF